MPAFGRTTPVYDIKMLGALYVYRDEKRLRGHLSIKEQAVLISIAYRCKTPGTLMPVNRICENFWPKNPRGARNLSRVLVSVRKTLKLPSHLLRVVMREGERMIENRGCYFITDYNEMKESVTSARALERAGEHVLAKHEYARALRLFRGQPCEKMYDPWSDSLRQAVVNLYEHAVDEYKRL